MIQVIPSEARYVAEHGWLTSRFSFSFAEYQDPSNRLFGVLRVFNDDTVQPGEGFGTHPHADMEIVTYVIDGTLEHRDSMGNIGVIRPGEVQTMTTGTGVFHSEYNHSQDEPVHFLQLWFLPNRRGLTPGYQQKQFTKEEQQNHLHPVVAPDGANGSLPINQDVTIFLSRLEAGHDVTHTQPEGRKMYVFVISGEILLNDGQPMRAGDAARITDVHALTLRAQDAGAEFMLIDLA
jgi:quercetin 2,3-dioxygenase